MILLLVVLRVQNSTRAFVGFFFSFGKRLVLRVASLLLT
jgi:hypothetical protein